MAGRSHQGKRGSAVERVFGGEHGRACRELRNLEDVREKRRVGVVERAGADGLEQFASVDAQNILVRARRGHNPRVRFLVQLRHGGADAFRVLGMAGGSIIEATG